MNTKRPICGILSLALPVVALLCSGCATLLTVNSGTPYAGVQADVGGMKRTFDTTSPWYIMPNWMEGILSTIDVPLSAVGDTVVLPYACLKKEKSTLVGTRTRTDNNIKQAQPK